MALLEIKDLCVNFGRVEAASGVSLAVEEGEMLAVIGESGSGKSVTALSVLGLLPSVAGVSGSVKFRGEEIRGVKNEKLAHIRGGKIGMVFQEPLTSLNPLHSIGRQLEEALYIHGKWEKAKIPARVEELLSMVELEGLKNRLSAYPHELSGGQRQRVMIAMALANDPELLIADEPTTALDVMVSKGVLELIAKLRCERKMAVMLVSHDLAMVRKYSQKLAVMKNGKVVEKGETAEIFANPRHEYTKTLLGSFPKGVAVPARENALPVLSARNVTVSFPIKGGVFARKIGEVSPVKDISLEIKEGMTLGLVGESGSGKTTLGMALLRLAPSEGEIGFMGLRLDRLSQKEMRPVRKRIQVVFQDPFASLNPRMTAFQIVAEGLVAHEAYEKQAVLSALSEVGISGEEAEKYPHEFSGGQRQRIAIARALALRPRIIVLDEPTSALDLTIQAQIIALLKDLQEKYGLSYLFISHDLRAVHAISHRIAVIREGKIIEEGETAEIFAHPKEKYTKALLEVYNSSFIG